MNQIGMLASSAAEFFRLADVAARNGGMWVSAAGGTARVAAGEIARRLNADYGMAAVALAAAGTAHYASCDWYSALADRQDDGYRWDARTVAAAAVRAVQARARATPPQEEEEEIM